MRAPFSVAAATALVDYDLLINSIYKRAGNWRHVKGASCNGSAAAGDTRLALYIDRVKVGTFYNRTTGFPSITDDLFPFDALVPPGSDISVIVEDAPATNPINGDVDIEDLA